MCNIMHNHTKHQEGEGVARVIIIGAGLTGLCTAYHLEQQGFYDYLIVEKQNQPGGLLRSVTHDGFIFDHTGHYLHISNPEFYTFLNTIVGIDNLNHIERNTAIFSYDTFTDYPFQMNLYGLPTEVTVACIEGYIKRARHIKHPQSFHQWVLKHFGVGFGKNFFFPYNKKLLAYDIKKVHPSWTGRFVPQTSLHNIIQGAIQKKPSSGIGYNSFFYYPKKSGIQFLIDALIRKLHTPVQINHAVQHIDTVNKTVFFANGKQEKYTTLVSTMPLNQLLKTLLSSRHNALSNAASRLQCNTVMNINIGYSNQRPLPFHWLYFPETKYPFYRMGLWNNISKHLCPNNAAGAYIELSYLAQKIGPSHASKCEEKAIKSAISFLGIKNEHVITQKTLLLDHAYVIYDAWREKNIKKILASLSELNIHSTGRYGAWKYASMQEAFEDGMRAAQHVLHTNHHTIPHLPSTQISITTI